MRIKMQILELDGTVIEEIEGEIPDDIAESYLADLVKKYQPTTRTYTRIY